LQKFVPFPHHLKQKEAGNWDHADDSQYRTSHATVFNGWNMKKTRTAERLAWLLLRKDLFRSFEMIFASKFTKSVIDGDEPHLGKRSFGRKYADAI